MTDDIRCPYCKGFNEINHDDGYGYEEDVYHDEECIHCEKTYQYTTTVSYWYDAYPAPCLNDGDHAFKKAFGGCSNPEYFKNRYRCRCCEKEIKVIPSCDNCSNRVIGDQCLFWKDCRPDLGNFFFNNWKLDIDSINGKK